MLKDERQRDELTNKPLRKGWQLHHLDLNETHYTDLTDKAHFSCLNQLSHKMVHFAYRYYCKDKQFVDRLVNILEKMDEINKDEGDNNECLEEDS